MKIRSAALILGTAVAGLDVYLFARIHGDLVSFVLIPSLFFAVPLVVLALVVDLFLRRRHTSSVMLAGFFAWILFLLGALAFIPLRGSHYHHHMDFSGVFDSLITGTITGLIGFCVTLACASRGGRA